MALLREDGQLSKLDQEKKFRTIEKFMQAVKEIINGKIDFDKNMVVAPISVQFTATNTEKAIAHNLGRTPRGFLVISSTAAANIYNGTSAWTDSNIYLKSSALTTVQLIFL